MWGCHRCHTAGGGHKCRGVRTPTGRQLDFCKPKTPSGQAKGTTSKEPSNHVTFCAWLLCMPLLLGEVLVQEAKTGVVLAQGCWTSKPVDKDSSPIVLEVHGGPKRTSPEAVITATKLDLCLRELLEARGVTWHSRLQTIVAVVERHPCPFSNALESPGLLEQRKPAD